jgi:hypothetical protein
MVERCANRAFIYSIIHIRFNRLQTVSRYFSRFRQTGGPGCTERFIHTMDLFFIAVAKQADDRAKGYIPDLESYIAVRRDTSGCKPCFALIEYVAQIDLPDEVMSHPVIMAMEEATNDLVTWSNVKHTPSSSTGALLTSLLTGYFLLQCGAISP